MATAAQIPELIQDFNLYLDGTKLLGVTSTVNLPEMEAMKATINGTGILGEYEAPALGHYGSMEQEIAFRVINKDYFLLCETVSALNLTLRGAIQTEDSSAMAKGGMGMRVVFRGHNTGVALNRVEQRNFMEASIKLNLTYYMVELNGENVLELDKLNSVYKVNGVDKLAYLRTLI